MCQGERLSWLHVMQHCHVALHSGHHLCITVAAGDVRNPKDESFNHLMTFGASNVNPAKDDLNPMLPVWPCLNQRFTPRTFCRYDIRTLHYPVGSQRSLYLWRVLEFTSWTRRLITSRSSFPLLLTKKPSPYPCIRWLHTADHHTNGITNNRYDVEKSQLPQFFVNKTSRWWTGFLCHEYVCTLCLATSRELMLFLCQRQSFDQSFLWCNILYVWLFVPIPHFFSITHKRITT